MSSQRLYGGPRRACKVGYGRVASRFWTAPRRREGKHPLWSLTDAPAGRPKLSRRGAVLFCRYALITLCLLLSCRLVVATDPGNSPGTSSLGPVNPATVNGQTDLTAPATPAMMALPVNSTPLGGDANSSRKWYTISASLREIYDDNVTTSNNNPQSSLETELSPTILVDFPSTDNDFSARYTMDITYYTTGPNTGTNGG